MVLVARPTKPRFLLPERIRRTPGRYRWVVFVLHGARIGRPIVDSTFTVAAPRGSGPAGSSK
jgi:hypothetical protein